MCALKGFDVERVVCILLQFGWAGWCREGQVTPADGTERDHVVVVIGFLAAVSLSPSPPNMSPTLLCLKSDTPHAFEAV